MTDSPPIRLLASRNNERGDLFTRLMKDLFFALGYDELRLNVHKSGRELDVEGKHRFEPRRLVAECKARAAKVGGDNLNKFFGALQRERIRHAPTQVAGYFVSISGFTETGIDQEIETRQDRIILLASEKIIEELEKCRGIISRDNAIEKAGRCVQHAGLHDIMLDGFELLGHQRGYLWAIYYESSKQRSHVALVHADGTPLGEGVAHEIIEADRLCGGSLHFLKYLAPSTHKIFGVAAGDVQANYRRWIGEECGYIHLDGLPADTDLSATRLKLERLFIPLRVIHYLRRKGRMRRRRPPTWRTSIPSGEFLKKNDHVVFLGTPGAGKSTLLKRLATAYAFPERRLEIADDLPDRDWLPLVLRCRELRDRAYRPIVELLDDIPRHAGMNIRECEVFQKSIHERLREGRILLLIDGLDEISDEGARQAFASHLRTFVAMFPQAALVVTSREAGFRLIAGVIVGVCRQAKLDHLTEEDVVTLCERWHVEVVGDNKKVRAEAQELGYAIWNNARIRELAENPLLLTTLLVVKRWIGELPRSRTALYRETIRVLIRTWNVEGYAPLDEDETLAQLSYVACAMMEEGNHQINRTALLRLLQDARQELEAELRFARTSSQEFLDRIEYRSSLLMQTGHGVDRGVTEPIYEFRHLTFQEYLAARGYVEQQYQNRGAEKSLADLLETHFNDERWREVIPLAAVLAGRKAEELIRRLTAKCESSKNVELRIATQLLHQCLRDEIQVTAPSLEGALLEIARYSSRGDSDWIRSIVESKFGGVLRDVVAKRCLEGDVGFEEYRDSLCRISEYAYFGHNNVVMSEQIVARLQNALEVGDRIDKIEAAVVVMDLAHAHHRNVESESTAIMASTCFQTLCHQLMRMLDHTDMPSTMAASWALGWIGKSRGLSNVPEPDMVLGLYRLWRQLESPLPARYLAWALGEQQLLPRDTFAKDSWGDCDAFLQQAAVPKENVLVIPVLLAALVVGWYRRAPWTDAELVQLITAHIDPHSRPGFELLENLGTLGYDALRKWR
jgi:energy-coupling factor transporter ATP-binding protein EcfA2